jgi:lipopolysaccharide biosynthesis glycosyltransferase
MNKQELDPPAKSKPRRALVFGIDSNYAMPLTVCLRSLLENSGSRTIKDIYILHSGVEEEKKELLHSSLSDLEGFQIHWIFISEQRFAHLSPGLDHVTRATYFRFLVAEAVPSNVENALYLDTDMIVLGDIEDIFDRFDPAWTVQACQDQLGCFQSKVIPLDVIRSFGINPRSAYFNSGLILYNLPDWRKGRFEEKVFSFAKEHPECLFIADQNAFNVVLNGQIGALEPEWNAQLVHPEILAGTFDVLYVGQPPMAEAKIFHYTSRFKPWGIGKDMPEAKPFLDFFSRTAWANDNSISSPKTTGPTQSP